MKQLVTFLFCLSLFHLHGQMILSGNATGGCDCYTLTTTTNQAGSVWSPSAIDLTNPFDFTFKINLGFSDGGADGMAFVLRKSGTTTGTLGSYLGYGGITNSVAIEVDTWNSDPAIIPGDIPADHIGMSANGVLNHGLVAAIGIANIEDGITHDFRVLWNPLTFEMQTFLDGVFIFTYTGDIVTAYFGGDPNVFFGWTGATGGASNIQTVCMELESEFSIDDLLVCPGQEVFFTSDAISGLNYNGIDVTNWSWNFGGGAISPLENPSYTYATIGTKFITLTVTNMLGCTDAKTLTLVVDSIDISVVKTDVTCFGFDNGTATVTALTGDAPFTFLWDDALGQVTATATSLAPGSYSVIVTDALGCTQTRSITITEPPALDLLDAIVTNAACGLNDGQVELIASGGTPAYEYSVNDGMTFAPGGIFTGLADGDLLIVLRDDNDCLFDQIVVIESDPLGITLTKTDVTCFEFDNGTATAIPDFGVGPCTYLWDDPLAQTTNTAVNLAAGTYNVEVTHNAVGCSGNGSITITQPDELLITSIPFTNASCGINNGLININVSGGTLPYEYSIDGGLSFFSTANFSGIAPGSYSIEVVDANGCVVTGNVLIINVSNIPTVLLAADPSEGCKALEVNLTNLSDPALTAFTEWNLGDGTLASGNFVNHTYTTAGCYDVHVEITTFDGCSTEATFTDFICVWELPIAQFSFTPKHPDILHNTVSFINQSEFAVNYDWNFGDGSTSMLFEPIHTYPVVGTVHYPVELIAITDKDCRDTIEKIVTVHEVVLYYIPNVFTPDGDEFNASFLPHFIPGFNPLDYHLVIYNRYGEILWESYDLSIGWNGTFGSQLVEDGVYIWHLTFQEKSSDKRYSEHGHVTILR